METETIKTLRGLGIASGFIVLIGAVAVSFYAYNKMLEAQLLRLNIKQAKRDLGIEGESVGKKIKAQVSNYINSSYEKSH